MTINKGAIPIRSLEEWLQHAAPKHESHWKDGRSAKEAARCWLAAVPGLPEEVDLTLRSHPDFGPIRSWTAEPEARVPFDKFPGEPRNSDLLVLAEDEHGSFAISVEAKADESFGEPVAQALSAAIERKLANPRSNGLARIEQLGAALFGPRRSGEPELGDLGYQLLTATAGALAAAAEHGMSRAVLLVHEFATANTSDLKHEINARDLRSFAHRLSHGSIAELAPGRLYGPVLVPGAPLFETVPRLYIGKARRDLRG